MRIELIYVPGCIKCVAERDALKSIAQELVAEVQWHDLNVLENIEYATRLGVALLPAIAINGMLAFSSALPTKAEFRETIKKAIT